MRRAWLRIHRGEAPLVVSIPHAGIHLCRGVRSRFASPWLARKDTDWWVDRLYSFAASLGATLVWTRISRSVIDVNRDPSGASLYPGQITTGVCPTTTFDGEGLYPPGEEPDEAEIAERRRVWFAPYHEMLANELQRLRANHAKVVLYDAHAIRSRAPRLFDGELPQFNIGVHGGASCDGALAGALEAICRRSGQSFVTNGRFKGGWITRHYGEPQKGVHAIQMELACRGYMDEPVDAVSALNWPSPYSVERAAPLQSHLTEILNACLTFARS